MPPAPGSMSASSRTATADGRKNTTSATSHSTRLASPNWLAAVVSQRSPTIAVMLNSTTSESRMTRGSRLGGSGMHRGGEPPDAAAQHRAARHVGGEMFAAGDRKSTRLNSSHSQISYAVLCLKKQKVRLEKAAITRQYPGARARAGTAEGEFASLHAAHRPAGLRDGRDIEREYALARPDMLAT